MQEVTANPYIFFLFVIEIVSKERLEVLQWPFILFDDHTSTPHIILLILDLTER